MTVRAVASRSAGCDYPADFRINRSQVILSTIAANLLALALPVMTLQIYDRILPNPDSGTLAVLVCGVTVAIALEAALKVARAYMIGWNGATYEYAVSAAAIRRLLHTDAARVRSSDAGEHLHRMAAVAKMKDFHSGYSLSAIIDVMFILPYAAFMAYVAGPLAAVLIGLLLAFALVSFAEGVRLRHTMKSREDTDDKRYNFIIEALNRIHSVKSFALENVLCRRYETLQESSVGANYGVAQETAAVFNTGTVMSHVMAAVTITIGAPMVLDGMVTTGALIAVLLLSGRMMQIVQRGLVLWVRYQDYVIARDRVRKIFDLPLVRQEQEVSAGEPQGKLTVRGLSFAFHDSGEAVLHDVNLGLGPGDVITIEGDGACGKTTLLNLISGVYPLQKGEIAIDGAGIAHYRPSMLARHVGYITAEPVIFRGTIRDNITRFGEIPEKDARRIAEMLGVDRDIARLPAGFDTVLYGNNNDTVPPGLKQRIAMTRVLAAKPRIILFDEADRFLDREGYRRVLRMLEEVRKVCAVILVTEDPEIRKLAKRRYSLTGGKLKTIAEGAA